MDKNTDEQQDYDKNDVLAFIIALYRIVIPQIILIGLGFLIVVYILLRYWLK